MKCNSQIVVLYTNEGLSSDNDMLKKVWEKRLETLGIGNGYYRVLSAAIISKNSNNSNL